MKLLYIYLLAICLNGCGGNSGSNVVNSSSTETKLSIPSNSWIDAPIIGYNNLTKLTYAIDSHVIQPPNGGKIITKDVNGSILYIQDICARNGIYCVESISSSNAFTSFNIKTVSLWFTSIYDINSNEKLAFMHEENIDGTGSAITHKIETWEGDTAIGLAYSSDSGVTWKYLGRIVTRISGNLEGTPYISKDGIFYVWFKSDSGIYSYECPITIVVDSAKKGLMAQWSPQNIKQNNLEGIIHSQAKKSDKDGKYYITTTKMMGGVWGNTNTYVKLYELNEKTFQWEYVRDLLNRGGDINNPNGYQYSSFINNKLVVTEFLTNGTQNVIKQDVPELQ